MLAHFELTLKFSNFKYFILTILMFILLNFKIPILLVLYDFDSKNKNIQTQKT
jgi:hypothetical protein